MATDVIESAVPPRLRYRVLRAGAWVATGFALDKLMALAQVVVLTRLLAPADFGLMALSAAVLLVLSTLSEMGLEQALVARSRVEDADLSVVWTLSVIRGVVLACCLWAFADFVAGWLSRPELAALLRVHALALVIQGAHSPALAILSRNLDLRRRVTLDLSRRLIEAGVTIGLALWLQSVWALLGGQLAGFVAGSALSYWVAPFCPRPSLHRPSLDHLLAFGKHLNVTTILVVGMMSGGEFVIGRMLGAETLGLYQVAMTIPLLLGVRATVVLSQVSFPAFSILRNDAAGVVRAFALQTKLVGLAVVPVAVGVAVLGPLLVPILFGPRWIDTVDPLRVLCLYAVCACFSGVMTSLQYGLNRPDLQARVAVVQCVLYAVAIVPLISQFGLVGAASALTVSYLAGCLLNMSYTARLLGEAVRPLFSSLSRIALFTGAVGVGLALLLADQPPSPSMFVFLGTTSAIAYGLYVWRVEYPHLMKLWNGDPAREC